MRPAKILLLVAYVAGSALAATVVACAKSPPEAHSAPAASSKTPAAGGEGKAPAGGTDDGQDNTPPNGVDVSKLDEMGKKVFFRVVNTEASICGKGQSLLASAKKDTSCRRSLSAVKYVAHLADQGYTQSEISESLEKRYRNVQPRFIDVPKRPSKAALQRA